LGRLGSGFEQQVLF